MTDEQFNHLIALLENLNTNLKGLQRPKLWDYIFKIWAVCVLVSFTLLFILIFMSCL